MHCDLRPFILCLLASPLLAEAKGIETESKPLDWVVCFINGKPITFSDVVPTIVINSKHADRIASFTLTNLIDDQLLLQEADRLGVQVDLITIRRMLQNQARASGKYSTSNQQRQDLNQQVKEARIRAVMQFYERHTDEIRPESLQITTPEMREACKLIIKPSDPVTRAKALERMNACIGKARSKDQPAAINALVTKEFLEQVRANEDEALGNILIPFIEALLKVPVAVDEARLLQAEARRALCLYRSPSLPQAQARLEGLRRQVEKTQGVDPRWALFRQAALELQGHDHLERRSSEQFNDDFEAPIRQLEAGGVSEVMTANSEIALIFVKSITPSTKSFGEKSSPLYTTLNRERQNSIRTRLLARLRRQAMLEFSPDIQTRLGFDPRDLFQDESKDDRGR